MKREAVLPLFVAVAVFMLLSPASSQARAMTTKAQASADSSTTARAQREAMRMVPAQAVLKNKIDARSILAGEKFQATLSGTVHLKNGPELPRGTKLIGTVVTDKMQAEGTSTLALRFTQAKLKNGNVVPIKATIVGIAGPVESYAFGATNNVPAYWNDKTLQVNQINAESGVNLNSAIASRNSGVFVTTKKDNVKLPEGAQLSLAIAARKSGHQHTMGMGNAGVSSGA